MIREGEQRDDAVEQPGAELVRALQEQQHVVGDAQMDVVDRVVDEADAVVAALRHPDRDVALGEPAPPADLQRLAEVILAGGRRDRAERDQAEQEQFALEAVPVLRLERIEEARIPLDHRHRHIDEAEFRADHAGEQRARAPAVLGAKIRKREGEERAQRDDDAIHDAGPVGTSRIIGMNGTRNLSVTNGCGSWPAACVNAHQASGQSSHILPAPQAPVDLLGDEARAAAGAAATAPACCARPAPRCRVRASGRGSPARATSSALRSKPRG